MRKSKPTITKLDDLFVGWRPEPTEKQLAHMEFESEPDDYHTDAFRTLPGNEAFKRALEIATAGNLQVRVIATDELEHLAVRPVNTLKMQNNVCFLPPCPCGNYMDFLWECTCTPDELVETWRGYEQRDYKFHVHTELTRVDVHKMFGGYKLAEPLYVVAGRIYAAMTVLIDRDHARYPNTITEDALAIFKQAIKTVGLGPVRVVNCVTTAVTIAALAGESVVGGAHIAEAVQYAQTRYSHRPRTPEYNGGGS